MKKPHKVLISCTYLLFFTFISMILLADRNLSENEIDMVAIDNIKEDTITNYIENEAVINPKVQQEQSFQLNLSYGAATILDVEKHEHYANEVKENLPINRWNIILTEEEIELLARIVMLEAGGETQEGQCAVIEVIFNRMIDEDFPNTLEEVLSQQGQFATWNNRNIKAAEPTNEVYLSIFNVLYGKTNILPYETVYFSVGGERGKVSEVVIGGHIFCNK